MRQNSKKRLAKQFLRQQTEPKSATEELSGRIDTDQVFMNMQKSFKGLIPSKLEPVMQQLDVDSGSSAELNVN